MDLKSDQHTLPAEGAILVDGQQDPDLELLKQAQAGEYSAFSRLIERYQARVYGLVMRIVKKHQDAEDAVQQTFVSLIEHLDSFRGESLVATWILKIATNHALKILRKNKRMEIHRNELFEDGYENLPHPEFISPWRDRPEIIAEQAEIQSLIHAALEQLDEKYQLVFILRDIEGLSVRETASALELTEANVKVRLLRARLLLREELTKKLGDEANRLFPSHDHG